MVFSGYVGIVTVDKKKVGIVTIIVKPQYIFNLLQVLSSDTAILHLASYYVFIQI